MAVRKQKSNPTQLHALLRSVLAVKVAVAGRWRWKETGKKRANQLTPTYCCIVLSARWRWPRRWKETCKPTHTHTYCTYCCVLAVTIAVAVAVVVAGSVEASYLKHLNLDDEAGDTGPYNDSYSSAMLKG